MGRGEREEAFSFFPSSLSRFYFSVIAIFIGLPNESLYGGESCVLAILE